MSSRSLSDLELVVMGVIWRDGPCTAYHVRQEFLKSPTSHWSGSQGAIYPLLKKLAARDLIESTAQSNDQRKTQLLTVTRDGKRQLRAWFDVEQPDDNLLQEYDAMRTRMFFVHVLSPAKRTQYFDHVARLLNERKQQIVQALEDCDNRQSLERIAWDGLLRSNQAKREWLKFARRTLGI